MIAKLKRREFITLLGGAAAWPLPARAQQQPARVPIIGVLAGGTPLSHGQLVAALLQRLRELGWIEGRTAAIEVRWAEGRVERFSEIATEFARLKVDVIVTSGLAVPAVRQAASTIPIVFAGASEPLAIGLVASLAQPGGNITGLSLQQTDYAGKRFELFREVLPELRRLAILGSVSAPGAMLEMSEVQAAARALGIEVLIAEIRRAEDIAPAFRMIAGRADALYVCPDALVTTNSIRINILAAGTTRSNLVGCSTGMSAGLAPRKTLSTRSAARRSGARLQITRS